jgi:hypothetical protein
MEGNAFMEEFCYKRQFGEVLRAINKHFELQKAEFAAGLGEINKSTPSKWFCNIENYEGCPHNGKGNLCRKTVFPNGHYAKKIIEFYCNLIEDSRTINKHKKNHEEVMSARIQRLEEELNALCYNIFKQNVFHQNGFEAELHTLFQKFRDISDHGGVYLPGPSDSSKAVRQGSPVQDNSDDLFINLQDYLNSTNRFVAEISKWIRDLSILKKNGKDFAATMNSLKSQMEVTSNSIMNHCRYIIDTFLKIAGICTNSSKVSIKLIDQGTITDNNIENYAKWIVRTVSRYKYVEEECLIEDYADLWYIMYVNNEIFAQPDLSREIISPTKQHEPLKYYAKNNRSWYKEYKSKITVPLISEQSMQSNKLRNDFIIGFLSVGFSDVFSDNDVRIFCKSLQELILSLREVLVKYYDEYARFQRELLVECTH